MEATSKQIHAGTRCECSNDKCGPERLYHSCGFCESKAVRMVTVECGNPAEAFGKPVDVVAVHVPMCAACAEWHEKGGAK